MMVLENATENWAAKSAPELSPEIEMEAGSMLARRGSAGSKPCGTDHGWAAAR